MKFLPAVLVASLFVSFQGASLAQEIAKPKLGVSIEFDGVILDGVSPNSIAAQAGLKAGDLIVSWDGQTTASVDDVLTARNKMKPGASSTFTIRRGNQTKELTFKLPASFPKEGLILGADVGSGVFVSDVFPGLPAASAGLKTGDVIIKIDDLLIEDFDGLRSYLSKIRPGTLSQFIVRRGVSMRTISVEFPRPSRGLLDDLGLGGLQLPQEFSTLGNLRLPGTETVKSLVRLKEVSSDLQKSIDELERLKLPELKATIDRLRKVNQSISNVTLGFSRMKDLTEHLRGQIGTWSDGNFDADAFRFQDSEMGKDIDVELKEKKSDGEFDAVLKRLQELTAGGVSDALILDRIIKKEFPGTKVEIQFAEIEDVEEVPARKKPEAKKAPTSKPASQAKKKATSRQSVPKRR